MRFIKEERRAQITLFVIITILIICGIIFFFFFKEDFFNVSSKNKSLLEVKGYLENCLKKTTLEGITFIASRGGYYNLPEDFFKDQTVTAFYDYNFYPDLNIFNKELSKYIEAQIDYCFEDKFFEERNIILVNESISSIFNEDSLIVRMHLPIVFNSGESISTLEDIKITLAEDKIQSSSNIAIRLIEELNKDKQILNILQLTKIAESSGFSLTIESYDSALLFKLNDNSDNSYLFQFAVKI